MKVTGLSAQIRNPDRVNVSIDGAYKFSLTLAQVIEHGLKLGSELSEQKIAELETESTYGKLYQRTLEYCLMRPRSEREVRDYLYRKTRSSPVRNRQTGQVTMREGVSAAVAERVLGSLVAANYVDDTKFTEFWLRHRFLNRGISARKLRAELMAKGVDAAIITEALQSSERSDSSEIDKVIAKKRARYGDDMKLMQYLARQGFSYDDIKAALAKTGDE